MGRLCLAGLLITSAGLVLHRLAMGLVCERTSNWITYSYYAGNALIGPTLGNFTDLCQLPLAVFALMLGLIERRGWLTLIAAILLPLIREDTGVLLVAIALWLLLRHRSRWLLALGLMAWGGGWMVVSTNLLMPLFSDDNAKRFMVENFGQYLSNEPEQGSSSLAMVQQALAQPLLLLQELVHPPGQTLLYLLGHGLPFLFIPLISLDTWVLAGPSLLGFLAQGANDPLSITIRTLLVVPGFALGCLFWWQQLPTSVPGRRTRLAWAVAQPVPAAHHQQQPPSQPSALIPDSVDPWVHSSPVAVVTERTPARLWGSFPRTEQSANTPSCLCWPDVRCWCDSPWTPATSIGTAEPGRSTGLPSISIGWSATALPSVATGSSRVPTLADEASLQPQRAITESGVLVMERDGARDADWRRL